MKYLRLLRVFHLRSELAETGMVMDDDDDIGDVAFGKERKIQFLVSKKIVCFVYIVKGAFQHLCT